MKDSILRLAVWFLILGVLYYFGWLAPHGERYLTDPIYNTVLPNMDDFYWRVHPFSFWDACGAILFSFGTCVITGAYKIVTGELYATKGEAGGIYALAAVVAALGGILFYV
jgi:hypothetical protein